MAAVSALNRRRVTFIGIWLGSRGLCRSCSGSRSFTGTWQFADGRVLAMSLGQFVTTGEPVRLEGGGLVLREWTEGDLDVMVQLFDEPIVA